MGAYGIHPTRYGNLDNNSLYSMYRSSVYSRLSENEKLDLLQETVNRDALEQGELGAPLVQFSALPSNESGNAANGIINVNYDMAVRGIQMAEYKGQPIEHHMDDFNIQALNTVLHENDHCFQDQVIDGTIKIDDKQLTPEYQANAFTTSAVLQNGSYKLGSHYLTGETPGGYYMYYFQATERDAHLYAEAKTNSILQGISAKYGTEPSFEAYQKSLAANGYQATHAEAVRLFQNPNFEKDLNQVLQNQFNGTSVKVDPATEKAVKAEMIETYRSMQHQITLNSQPSVREDNKMEFDPNKPVTLEEYNQTLRDSMNAYYTHAMNDPSMSHEDAIKSTSEVAEKYLDAVDEFKEAQNNAVQNNTEMGSSVDSGMNGTSGTSGLQSGTDAAAGAEAAVGGMESGGGGIQSDDGNAPAYDNGPDGLDDGNDGPDGLDDGNDGLDGGGMDP